MKNETIEKDFCRLCNVTATDIMTHGFIKDLFEKYTFTVNNGGTFYLKPDGHITFRLHGHIATDVSGNMGFIGTIEAAYQAVYTDMVRRKYEIESVNMLQYTDNLYSFYGSLAAGGDFYITVNTRYSTPVFDTLDALPDDVDRGMTDDFIDTFRTTTDDINGYILTAQAITAYLKNNSVPYEYKAVLNSYVEKMEKEATAHV